MDFEHDYYAELAAPKSISTKCDISKVQVTIEGLCEKCRKKHKGRYRLFCVCRQSQHGRHSPDCGNSLGTFKTGDEE